MVSPGEGGFQISFPSGYNSQGLSLWEQLEEFVALGSHCQTAGEGPYCLS